jgi:pSer/pThr/pTyr-binding forkhead associated (FHA) protein
MHAIIVYKKGEYILFEHGTTGQSYVNGVEVTECSLRDGDILRFGSTSFGFFHRSSSWYGGF